MVIKEKLVREAELKEKLSLDSMRMDLAALSNAEAAKLTKAQVDAMNLNSAEKTELKKKILRGSERR